MAHLSWPCCNRAKWPCFILFLSLSFWCKSSIVSCPPIWPPATHFLKGLAFPRSAKLIFRKVWHFRARRNSFSEWFGISALGENHFPNGLAFPRMAKVISRMVLCLRASRKSVLKGFDTTRYKAKINQQKNF